MITSPRQQQTPNEMCGGLGVRTEQEMLTWQVIRLRVETWETKFPPLGLSNCSPGKKKQQQKTTLGEEKVPASEEPIKYWFASETTLGPDTL